MKLKKTSISSPDDFECVPIRKELIQKLKRHYRYNSASFIEALIKEQIDILPLITYNSLPPHIEWKIGDDYVILFYGTQIRTIHRGVERRITIGKWHKGPPLFWTGRVEKPITYEDKTVKSPSELATLMRGEKSEKPWEDLEVKRPGDITWMPLESIKNKPVPEDKFFKDLKRK